MMLMINTARARPEAAAYPAAARWPRSPEGCALYYFKKKYGKHVTVRHSFHQQLITLRLWCNGQGF